MTLGQFAIAVGAPKRWVQNACAALGLPRRYTEGLARRLAFAKLLKDACRTPLVRAYPLAAAALAAWPGRRTWVHHAPDGVVTVAVDLERFLSDCVTRLSLARCFYAERQRGRATKRRRRGVAWAKWYGVDVTLLHSSLRQTPAQRFQRLEDAAQFFRSVRGIR